MKGFKEFLLQGNLIELAVAFIMGTAFAEVVQTFAGIITDIIGKFFAVDAFSQTQVAGINIGAFITAVIMFLISSFVLYFAVVTPYNKYKSMRGLEEAAEKSEAEILVEIRDLLAGR